MAARGGPAAERVAGLGVAGGGRGVAGARGDGAVGDGAGPAVRGVGDRVGGRGRGAVGRVHDDEGPVLVRVGVLGAEQVHDRRGRAGGERERARQGLRVGVVDHADGVQLRGAEHVAPVTREAGRNRGGGGRAVGLDSGVGLNEARGPVGLVVDADRDGGPLNVEVGHPGVDEVLDGHGVVAGQDGDPLAGEVIVRPAAGGELVPVELGQGAVGGGDGDGEVADAVAADVRLGGVEDGVAVVEEVEGDGTIRTIEDSTRRSRMGNSASNRSIVSGSSIAINHRISYRRL